MGEDQQVMEVHSRNVNLGHVFPKDAKESVDYDTEPVTSASGSDDDNDEESLVVTRVASFKDQGSQFFSTDASVNSESTGHAAGTSFLEFEQQPSMSSLDEVQEIGVKQTGKNIGLDADFSDAAMYMRMDIQTQFILAEHGIRSLEDLGSLAETEWKPLRRLVKTFTGDIEQSRKVEVLRKWIQSMQAEDIEGKSMPKDWRRPFLKALPKLKRDARKSDWKETEELQMRFIDSCLPTSVHNFIHNLSQCGMGSTL